LLIACALAGMGVGVFEDCGGAIVGFSITGNGPGTTSSEPLANGECLTVTSIENFVSWSAGCDCQNETTTECNGANQCAAPRDAICVANFCTVSTLTVVESEGGNVRVSRDLDGGFREGLSLLDEGGTRTREFCNGQDGAPVGTPFLEARPADGRGWSFDHWEGDCAGTDPTIYVTLDVDRTCTAVFTRPELSLAVSGSGAVAIPGRPDACRSDSPPGSCTNTFPAGQWVTLTAIPDPLQRLEAWGGHCEVPDDGSNEVPESIEVPMDGDKLCSASFSTVAVGAGSGVVEIVSLADDESLLPNGATALNFTVSPGFDASGDLSEVSFGSNGLGGLVRNRPLETTQEIRPPAVAPFFVEAEPISLSADGRAVAYEHQTLVPASEESGEFFVSQVYRRDLDPLGPADLISAYDPDTGIGGIGEAANAISPSISGNGRFVVYLSAIPFLRDDPDSGAVSNGVVVYDSCAGAPPAGASNGSTLPPMEGCTPGPVAISYDEDGESIEVAFTQAPRISRDGRFVLYAAYPDRLLLHDRDSDDDGVYDETGATSTTTVVENVDVQFRGPFLLDASGRYVGFRSTDPTLVDATTGATNANPPFTGRAFLRDTCAGEPPTTCAPADHLLSVLANGQPVPEVFDFDTRLTDVSASARFVGLDTGDSLLFQTTTVDGRFGVIRDTCIGAPPGPPFCTPTNRLLSRRTNGELLLGFGGNTSSRISDDGSLAALLGPRNALVGSPGGNTPEALLSVTGFLPELGEKPSRTSRRPSAAPRFSDPFLVTVVGDGFVPGVRVTRGPTGGGAQEPRETIFISDRRLQVWLEEEDFDVPGPFLLRIVNPGGDTSDPVTFTVTN
jgi:hypothetical protein